MKKIASIKMRITIWYTSLMFVLIAVVLALVGTVSYKLSIDNIEKSVTARVSQVAEKLGSFQPEAFDAVGSDEEFKNVTIYGDKGNYIVGQYIYDVSGIEFKDGSLRRETVGGKEYIIYDVKKETKPMPPGNQAPQSASAKKNSQSTGKTSAGQTGNNPPSQENSQSGQPENDPPGQEMPPVGQAENGSNGQEITPNGQNSNGQEENQAPQGASGGQNRPNPGTAPGGQITNRRDNGFWIRGAEAIDSTILFGRSTFLAILFIVPLILLLAALGGFYIAKKSFSPINDIIATANGISESSDIEKRIEISPAAKKDELYNLSVTLNCMLDRIEDLINKEKQFTSDASHELRTPISVILAQGEYLLDIAANEKEKELAENITQKANQMSKLVSRLLTLSRIDQNRQKLNKEKVDIAVIVDIAAENLQSLAEKKGITVVSSVPENTIVAADEALILSAVTNLISNGIKYGKQGGHIEISASKGDTQTEIVVSDDGIGISKENINKIWGRFFRVDDVRNDEYGSCGLGLSMVMSIVRLHGGSAEVKSEVGKGTEFRITLNNE